MSSKRNLFHPSAKKREAPYWGRISSVDYNSFQDEVIRDLSRLQFVINDLVTRYDKRTLELEEEIRKLSSKVKGVQTELDLARRVAAVGSADQVYYQSFTDIEDLDFSQVSLERRLRIEPTFGIAMLPFNQGVSRFYIKNPQTDELFVPTSLNVTVTPVDEGNGDVIEGDPKLAVDGRASEGWVRQVKFPISSDQDSVTMDIDIDVPTTIADTSNILKIFPAPAGECDILDIKYSSSSAAPSTTLPGFSPKYQVSGAFYHFAPTVITKLRIRLRQRHFLSEEAEKTFLYGLKEVHLDLVELDKTAISGNSSNQAVWKVSAPSGYTFNTLKEFYSDPDHSGNSFIHFEIYKEASLTTSIWQSDSTPLTTTPIDISSDNLSTIYVVSRLGYDTGNNVSPVLNSFYLRYSTQ